MGASELSGAAIGGMVACLTVLLLLIVSSIGGYFLYHSLHKKSKYSLSINNPDIGMSFKNGEKITLHACSKCYSYHYDEFL